MPADGPKFVWRYCGLRVNSAELRNLLRVQSDGPMIPAGQPLDLLGNAEFGPVLPVQERRNDSEVQFSPALEPLPLGRARWL
jgi:hypothetical protein